MTTWLVTRHKGAIEWIARQKLIIERYVKHLDPIDIQSGDVVIGILPVNIAAEVCMRGARYINISLNMPPEARGRELSADELVLYQARLEEYSVGKAYANS